MNAEVIDQIPVGSLPEAGSPETYLLAILERHDGLCLDNESELCPLEPALARALLLPPRNRPATVQGIVGQWDRVETHTALTSG